MMQNITRSETKKPNSSLLSANGFSEKTNPRSEEKKELPIFLTMEDVAKILPWGENTIQALFNEKDFPACNFGKAKVVEINAFLKYFAVRRDKENAKWKGGTRK